MFRARAPLIVLVCSAALSCVPWRGPDDVVRIVERGTGARYDRETGLTLGRGGLSVAKWAVDDEDVPLDGLRKLELGVYRPIRPADGTRTLSARSFPGWTPIAEVRTEPEEQVLILADVPGESIRRLLIVVAEHDELTVVRMHGELDGIVRQAVREAFDEVDRSDLAEPTLAALDDAEGGS